MSGLRLRTLFISPPYWRALRAIKQRRLTSLQIADEKRNIDAVEAAIAVDIARAVKGKEKRRTIAGVFGSGSSLKICHAVGDVDTIARAVAVDVTDNVIAAAADGGHPHPETGVHCVVGGGRCPHNRLPDGAG